MNDLESFANLVQAIDPWRGKLVFIGGWCHRLHTLHPQANQLEFQPVFTKDTDLAFANRELLDGSIKEALIQRGFQEDFAGEARPPVTHYTLGNDNSGFYAEFLTPLIGSPVKRDGSEDATMLAAGISAQKIRHLGILLVDPWIVTVGEMNGFPLPRPVDLLVANPLCFMVQKFLIKQQRPPAKQSQDLLYIFDTIQLFGNLIPDFKECWGRTVMPNLEEKAVKTVIKECSESFKTITDTIRNAADIPRDRQVSPEDIRATCQYVFNEILGLEGKN